MLAYFEKPGISCPDFRSKLFIYIHITKMHSDLHILLATHLPETDSNNYSDSQGNDSRFAVIYRTHRGILTNIFV